MTHGEFLGPSAIHDIQTVTIENIIIQENTRRLPMQSFPLYIVS